MIENQKHGFKDMMHSITTIYSKPELDRETLRIWWAKLEKYDFMIISKAFDTYVNSNKYMPTISDILDLCRMQEKPQYTKALPRHFTEQEIKNNHDKMKQVVNKIASKPVVDNKAWARRILNDADKGKYKLELGIKFAKEALKVK